MQESEDQHNLRFDYVALPNLTDTAIRNCIFEIGQLSNDYTTGILFLNSNQISPTQRYKSHSHQHKKFKVWRNNRHMVLIDRYDMILHAFFMAGVQNMLVVSHFYRNLSFSCNCQDRVKFDIMELKRLFNKIERSFPLLLAKIGFKYEIIKQRDLLKSCLLEQYSKTALLEELYSVLLGTDGLHLTETAVANFASYLFVRIHKLATRSSKDYSSGLAETQ